MSYYRPCPYCGANLDPGERCDCQGEPVSQTDLHKKAALDATNIDDGRVEKDLQDRFSTSNDSEN